MFCFVKEREKKIIKKLEKQEKKGKIMMIEGEGKISWF